MLLSYVFVPSEVKVAPGRVTLFDLASTFTGVSERDLKSITIAYMYQGSQTFLSNYIGNLAKRRGIDVTFESSFVTVSVVKEKGPGDTSDVVEEASEAALFVATSTGVCEAPSTWSLLFYSGEVSGGEKTYKVHRIGKGIFSVFVRYQSGKFLYMKLKVSCLGKIPVLKRSVSAGEIIRPEWVDFKYGDVLALQGTPASTSDVFYAKARFFMRAGEVLTLEKIRRKPDVLKGQILIAYVRLPGIYVTTLVRALEDGYVGDTIRVKNIESGKIIKGTVEEGPVVRVLEVK